MFCKIVLFLMLIGFSCSAQNIIKPGDDIIDYSLIKPSHEFYKNTIRDTSGNIKIEFMMENVSTIDSVNKRITFARFRQAPFGSTLIDTSVTDMQLRPIYMHEVRPQPKFRFDMTFEENNVTVKTTNKGVLTVKNYPMQKGYFEDNMIEYTFGYLNLKMGKVYTLDNFNEANSGPNPYTLQYVFDDTWNSPIGNNLNCSVIRFTNGDLTGYIWVDKHSHKMLKEVGRGKNSTFVITKE